jgi:hypothetical protein
MTKRIVIAGLVAGLVLYVWESVAHMALPLGEAGISVLDHEAGVLDAIKANVKQDGFYFFPNPYMAGTPEQQKQAEQKILSGPTGLLIVRPNGDPGLTASRLILQFVFDVLSMTIAAFVLSRAVMVKGLGARLGLVVLLACLPTLRTELPQWNWFAFPISYTAAQLTLHLVGFALGGFVLARLIRVEG